MKTTLLLIDPQNDFMDVERASLAVPGAEADMRRVAAYIRAHVEELDDIVVTLDTQELLDIGHHVTWRDREGRIPAPFTRVTRADVKSGSFHPADRGVLPRVLAYLEALESLGRYTHTLWPVHCQVGSWGHNIHPDVLGACNEWEHAKGRAFQRLLKGQNPFTESYSAVRAEVVDPADPGTDTNHALLARLGRADRLLVAGEALSHCVRATVDDVIAYSGIAPHDVARRVVVFGDACSPVAGFEAQGREFLDSIRALGGSVAAIG